MDGDIIIIVGVLVSTTITIVYKLGKIEEMLKNHEGHINIIYRKINAICKKMGVK